MMKKICYTIGAKEVRANETLSTDQGQRRVCADVRILNLVCDRDVCVIFCLENKVIQIWSELSEVPLQNGQRFASGGRLETCAGVDCRKRGYTNDVRYQE